MWLLVPWDRSFPLQPIVWFWGSSPRLLLGLAEQCLVLLLLGACSTKSELITHCQPSSNPWQWLIIKTSDKLTIFLLPPEWQEIISAPGWLVLTGFVAFETLSLVTPFRAAKFDHFAHLGGYLAGTVWALTWKAEREKKRQEEMTWLDKLFSSKWSILFLDLYLVCKIPDKLFY